jgi:hypothetical protein
VASTLSRIPLDRRRRLAATVALFASLFVAVGAVATTGPADGGVRAFAALAFVAATFLALTAWGLVRSVRLDAAERRLDDAIAKSVAASGVASGVGSCGCGHDHDANELHVQGATAAAHTATFCEQDGRGVSCSHSCEVCVLSTMRPSPDATRAARAADRGRV